MLGATLPTAEFVGYNFDQATNRKNRLVMSVDATTAEKGVIYSASDRIGIGGRFLIIVIDSSIVLIAGIACLELSRHFDPGNAFLAWLIFTISYLIVLKATPLRTIGYRVCGAKLVDMQGATPNVLRIICRLLLTQIGICNPILDPFWFRMGRKRTLPASAAKGVRWHLDVDPIEFD